MMKPTPNHAVQTRAGSWFRSNDHGLKRAVAKSTIGPRVIVFRSARRPASFEYERPTADGPRRPLVHRESNSSRHAVGPRNGAPSDDSEVVGTCGGHVRAA